MSNITDKDLAAAKSIIRAHQQQCREEHYELERKVHGWASALAWMIVPVLIFFVLSGGVRTYG